MCAGCSAPFRRLDPAKNAHKTFHAAALRGNWSNVMHNKLLRTADVLDRLSISRETLRRWRISGLFLEPRQIGPGTLAWDFDDIEIWLETRPRACLTKRQGEPDA